MIKLSSKWILFILTVVWCFPAVGFALSGKDEFQDLLSGANATTATQLYTSYNLFTEKGNVHAINFQVGTVIPAGTPVKIEFIDSNHAKYIRIKFTTIPDNRTYRLKFQPRYHPGKTIYDYANLMFGKKTFEEITAGYTPTVINAIRRGAVVKGMTKKEVITSYGYPPEHKTSTLRADNWLYWKNRFIKKRLCFDNAERAIDCKERRNDDL